MSAAVNRNIQNSGLYSKVPAVDGCRFEGDHFASSSVTGVSWSPHNVLCVATGPTVLSFYDSNRMDQPRCSWTVPENASASSAVRNGGIKQVSWAPALRDAHHFPAACWMAVCTESAVYVLLVQRIGDRDVIVSPYAAGRTAGQLPISSLMLNEESSARFHWLMAAEWVDAETVVVCGSHTDRLCTIHMPHLLEVLATLRQCPEEPAKQAQQRATKRPRAAPSSDESPSEDSSEAEESESSTTSKKKKKSKKKPTKKTDVKKKADEKKKGKGKDAKKGKSETSKAVNEAAASPSQAPSLHPTRRQVAGLVSVHMKESLCDPAAETGESALNDSQWDTEWTRIGSEAVTSVGIPPVDRLEAPNVIEALCKVSLHEASPAQAILRRLAGASQDLPSTTQPLWVIVMSWGLCFLRVAYSEQHRAPRLQFLAHVELPAEVAGPATNCVVAIESLSNSHSTDDFHLTVMLARPLSLLRVAVSIHVSPSDLTAIPTACDVSLIGHDEALGVPLELCMRRIIPVISCPPPQPPATPAPSSSSSTHSTESRFGEEAFICVGHYCVVGLILKAPLKSSNAPPSTSTTFLGDWPTQQIGAALILFQCAPPRRDVPMAVIAVEWHPSALLAGVLFRVYPTDRSTAHSQFTLLATRRTAANCETDVSPLQPSAAFSAFALATRIHRQMMWAVLPYSKRSFFAREHLYGGTSRSRALLLIPYHIRKRVVEVLGGEGNDCDGRLHTGPESHLTQLLAAAQPVFSSLDSSSSAGLIAAAAACSDVDDAAVDELRKSFVTIKRRYAAQRRTMGVEMFLRSGRSIPAVLSDAAAFATAEVQHWRGLLLLMLRVFELRAFVVPELVLSHAVLGLHRWLQWSTVGRGTGSTELKDAASAGLPCRLEEFHCLNALRYVESYISRLDTWVPAVTVPAGEGSHDMMPPEDIAGFRSSLKAMLQKVEAEKLRVHGPKSRVAAVLRQADASCWDDASNLCSVCEETPLPSFVPVSLSISLDTCKSVRQTTSATKSPHRHTTLFSPLTFRSLRLYDPESVVAKCKSCGLTDTVCGALCNVCDGMFQ